MEPSEARAYRFLLSMAMWHLKVELGGLLDGVKWLKPWWWSAQSHIAMRAAHRAYAFHNLAICAAYDFAGFEPDLFWADVEKFHRQFPKAWCPYRAAFERLRQGESLGIYFDGVNP